MRSTTQNNQGKVSIVVLRNNNGLISENVRVQIRQLTIKLNNDNYQITYINEAENAKNTAVRISKKNPDFILIDKNISLSQWEIINHCSAQAKTKPKFYLDGLVEDIIDKEVKKTSFSGAIGIDKGGTQITRKAYKQANRDKEHPVRNTIDTRFNIGSVTKMMTAVAVLRMVDLEKIDLNTPISTILKEKKIDYAHKEIFDNFTLHELLTHTSGLDSSVEESIFKGDMLHFQKLDNYLPWIERATADQDLQERHKKKEFSYSNVGYCLLGFAIKAITGQEYHTYVQQNVLQQAGMKNTVPVRDASHTYALAYTEKPPSSLDNEAAWLEQMKKAEEDNTELLQFIVTAQILLKKTQEYMQNKSYREPGKIIQWVEQQLGSINAKDIAPELAFSQFKNALAMKINEAYVNLQNLQDPKKLQEELRNTFVSLNEWIKKNEKNPDPDSTRNSVINAKKLLRLFAQESLYSYLEWPKATVNAPIDNLSLSHPAGKWFSTIADLFAFNHALWDKTGKLAEYGERLILMQDNTSAEEKPKPKPYGYGTMVIGEGDKQSRGHYGGAPGARASCFTYPESGFMLATLANNENPPPQALVEMLENNLIFSANNRIEYFDAKINPAATLSFLQDVVNLSLEKNKDHRNSQTASPATSGLFSSAQNKTAIQKEALDVSDEKMAKSTFGQSSNTCKFINKIK